MILVHLAKGFEEIEAVTVTDILRRAGLDAHFVSVYPSREVVGAHGIVIDADYLYQDIDYGLCEMIVLPGGLPGADNLQAHEGLRQHVKCFAADSSKKLAAICAAPQVFGACGILEGKNATIYPGMESHLAGGNATGKNVTVDGNIITGMGPALAMEFALKLVEEIKGKEAAEEVAQGLLYDRV